MASISYIETLWKIIQSLFSSITFLSLKLVCLCDIDDAVKKNTIIVLFNYEGIAILETMAPTLENETVKCWLLSWCSKCSIYEWYMSVKKLRSVNWFWSVCWSRNWEDSSDFELFDIWKVINIDLNGNRTSEKLWYIRVFDI